MKGRPVEQLVYEYMFPKPRPTDPPSFQGLLQRSLILEVRQEVQSFYGHLETQEAKYPGLDYCHPTHRIRLSRWQWHRRLFRAFDALRLTPAEIAGLTKWEGTRWAKERFEAENGVVIRDTAADDFPDWTYPQDRLTARVNRAASQETDVGAEDNDHNMEEDIDEDEDEDEDSDRELQSVGFALNERLRERVALRNASGDTSIPLDEEWEQWLKNAIEAGELPHGADQIARLSSSIASGGTGGAASRNADSIPAPSFSSAASSSSSSSTASALTPDDIFPSRMLTAARAGMWHEVPDFLRDIVRQSLQGTTPPPASTSGAATLASGSAASPPLATSALPTSSLRRTLYPEVSPLSTGVARWRQRRTYSDLRLPGADAISGSGSSVARRAPSPGAS